jgi:hypothetical protein
VVISEEPIEIPGGSEGEKFNFGKIFSGNSGGDGGGYRRSDGDGDGKEDDLKYFGSGQPLRHYESDTSFQPRGAWPRESSADAGDFAKGIGELWATDGRDFTDRDTSC